MTYIIPQLSQREQQTILECMNAVLNGPFIPEWEFDTLLGVSRHAMNNIIANWPDVVIQDKNIAAAIIGAMNNLLGYPHGADDHWHEYISVSPETVKGTLEKLLALGL